MATTEEHEIQRMEGEAGPSHPEEHARPDADVAAASRPDPSEAAEEALQTFAKHANWSLLHPCDDERFETFMRLATAAKWTSMEVEARLVQLGLPEGLSQQLRRRYWNRTRPLPLAGTDRRQMDEQIKTLNAKLTRRTSA